MESRRKQLDHWFANMPGKLLLEMESRLLSNLLPRLFGYHLLQIGGPSNTNWLNHCKIPHHIFLSNDAPCPCNGSCVVGNYESLPFQPDSLDVVLLPHILEFARNPYQILEEVYQTLIPEGHVVILGFQPWSLWGIARLLRNRKKIPWNGKFYSSFHVRHWLNLMGFKIENHETLFFRPPLKSKSLLERLLFLEAMGQIIWPYLGGVYLIVAKKRMEILTPIRSNLPNKRIAIPRGVAQPTARVQ